MTWRSLVITIVLLASACGSPQTSAPPQDPGPVADSPHAGPVLRSPSEGRVVEGFWSSAGSPPPLARATDADCVYGGTVDDTGCCWSFRDMNAVAQSRAYATWLASHRESACGGVDCPSPPVPSEPPACLFQVRCDTTSSAGTCVNACTPMVPGTS